MAGRFGRKSHQRKKVTSICQNYNGTAAGARCFQRPNSQKTLRTVVRQSILSFVFDVCKWQITMAHWFQTPSAQRKQVTSLCQNYHGTAAESRCFQRPSSQKTLRTDSGASVYFIFCFWCPQMTNHNGTLVSNIFSPTKASHIIMSELQWHSCRSKMLPKAKLTENITFSGASVYFLFCFWCPLVFNLFHLSAIKSQRLTGHFPRAEVPCCEYIWLEDIRGLSEHIQVYVNISTNATSSKKLL